MKTSNRVIKALVISFVMFGGAAYAANYSPTSAITPTSGEVWGGSRQFTTSAGAFSDTLSFSFNAPATVSFYVDGFWGTTFNDFKAEWVGTAPSGSVLTHTNTANPNGDRWSSSSFAAVAGTTYSLKLSQNANAVNGGSYTFHLNGAAVPAVPEPETFAMLLAGLGLVSLASRKRQTKASVTA